MPGDGEEDEQEEGEDRRGRRVSRHLNSGAASIPFARFRDLDGNSFELIGTDKVHPRDRKQEGFIRRAKGRFRGRNRTGSFEIAKHVSGGSSLPPDSPALQHPD